MKSYDYLISYNIKPSVQRIAIMDLLAHKTHPSIDEIYLRYARTFQPCPRLQCIIH